MALTRPFTRPLIRPLTRGLVRGYPIFGNPVLSSDELFPGGALSVTGGTAPYQLFREMGMRVAGAGTLAARGDYAYAGLDGGIPDSNPIYENAGLVASLANGVDIFGAYSLVINGDVYYDSPISRTPAINGWVSADFGEDPPPTVTRIAPASTGSPFPSASTFPDDAETGFTYFVRDANGNESNVLIIPDTIAIWSGLDTLVSGADTVVTGNN